ncbi:MAG: flavoprotein [bacterium]
MSKAKNIILGVTGSIAAYKAAELASTLTKAGVEVNVVMTPEAQELITPLTFFSLTHRQVISTLWNEREGNPVTHISLADRADLVVVAPATAHVLAQMAHGLASDALTTVLLATKAPVLVAPAMNEKMWTHPATQENVATLQKRGVEFLGPDEGSLACGYKGKGRLWPVEKIAARILEKLK